VFSKDDSILVVAPHADDEWLGAGGTLLRFGETGAVVGLLGICCDSPERHEEFRRSAARMNALWAEVAGFPDSELDTTPLKEVVGTIEAAIDEGRPTVLMIPEPGVHQDHLAVHRACLAAIRSSREYIPPTVLEYEVPTGTTGRDFRPNLWVDITPTAGIKAEEFEEIYRSQVGPSRCADTVLRHAAYRGKEAGVGYAEAFQVWRAVL
jgi:LmbE family N-acetylglucosaminyl deacetylase